MIILTGAAGFIGSQVAKHFDTIEPLLLVDHPAHFKDRQYFQPKEMQPLDFATDKVFESRHRIMDRAYLPKVLAKLAAKAPAGEPTAKEHVLLSHGDSVKCVIHLGACTNTAETRKDFLQEWNVDYSKALWKWCAQHQVPYIYASSGATFGGGENGFSDSHEIVPSLKPLNPYGQSKQDFDLWVLDEIKSGRPTPPRWYGLKFFNVYGPNEGHKGRMASSILHTYKSVARTGRCQLFKSHNPKYKDGEQSRDFIHVQDIVSIIDFLREKLPASGLYNCGTGEARTFLSMVQALFAAVKKPVAIDWIDTPPQFRAGYQYFTEAKMDKLRAAGYKKPFVSLESGVEKYVEYLEKNHRIGLEHSQNLV